MLQTKSVCIIGREARFFGYARREDGDGPAQARRIPAALAPLEGEGGRGRDARPYRRRGAQAGRGVRAPALHGGGRRAAPRALARDDLPAFSEEGEARRGDADERAEPLLERHRGK